MEPKQVKTENTPASDHHYKWIYYAAIWLAFTKLFFYAQEWFSIDRQHENSVLNNIYYSMDAFFHVLVIWATVKAGAWFSKAFVFLLVFFSFRFLLLTSFIFYDRENWNLDLPWITSLFFVLCGIGCVVITIKDLIKRL